MRKEYSNIGVISDFIGVILGYIGIVEKEKKLVFCSFCLAGQEVSGDREVQGPGSLLAEGLGFDIGVNIAVIQGIREKNMEI